MSYTLFSVVPLPLASHRRADGAYPSDHKITHGYPSDDDEPTHADPLCVSCVAYVSFVTFYGEDDDCGWIDASYSR